MSFDRSIFFIFFLFVFFIFYLLPHKRRSLFLLCSSLIFYGWWDYRFLSLLFISSTLDFIAGEKIFSASDKRIKKLWLSFALGGNLVILGFFKYFNFFIDSLNYFFGANIPIFDIVLPVGISFYTFQSMSYSIDIFRNHLKPLNSWVDYAFFVTFFPQLVAGPIVRAIDFIHQIPTEKSFCPKKICDGMERFFIGLIKKLAVADVLGNFVVDPIFKDPSCYSSSSFFLAIFCFSIQIYCDFSGYSDMAIGTARMLGYHFRENFEFPYLSCRPSEFWRRWHISLSLWLRDYVYIPLGGNRDGRLRMYRNLILTMLLGGLWHGAGWTFVLWGMWQGLLLVIEKLLDETRKVLHINVRVPRIIQWVITYPLVLIGWLLFRVDSLSNLKSIFFINCFPAQDAKGLIEPLTILNHGCVLIAICLFFIDHLVGLLKENYGERHSNISAWLNYLWPLKGFLFFVLLFYILIFVRTKANPFIYFQF